MHTTTWRLLALAALGTPLVACGRTDETARNDSAAGTVAMADSSGVGMGTGGNTGTMSGDSAGGTMSGAMDAGVASFLGAVNEAEIETGRLATTKARNGEVKDFARDMVEEHQKVEADLQSLGSRNGWANANTGMLAANMTQLQQSRDQLMTTLRGATGAAFDRAYIDGQVAAHQQTLDVLRQHATSLQNTELRDQVTSIQKDVEEHLSRAQALSKKLTGG